MIRRQPITLTNDTFCASIHPSKRSEVSFERRLYCKLLFVGKDLVRSEAFPPDFGIAPN